MTLEATPAVRRFSLRGVPTELEQSQLVNITCAITMDITRGGDTLGSVSLSPFSNASELERSLNSLSALDGLGYVVVEKRGYDSSPAGFWLSDSPVEFTVIFLTRFGIPMATIPTLSISTSASCVSADSSSIPLNLTVGMENIQDLRYPTSFDVGFNFSSQLQRATKPLPLTASPEVLRDELTELLSWGCVEEENLDEKTLIYENYESSGRGRRRDNSTSFCGSYSDSNAFEIWSRSEQPFRIDEFSYVSHLLETKYSQSDK